MNFTEHFGPTDMEATKLSTTEIAKKANTGKLITCPHESALQVHEGCLAFCKDCAICHSGGLYDSMGYIN